MNIITIDYFFKIKNNIPSHILDKKVIDSIDKLGQLVSAPEYNRTPDFIIDKYRKANRNLLLIKVVRGKNMIRVFPIDIKTD